MIKARKEHEGINNHRLAREVLEGKFVRKWREINAGPYGDLDYRHLGYLISKGDIHTPDTPSDRDIKVAETIVQWLGSPVGQAFLRDVGSNGFIKGRQEKCSACNGSGYYDHNGSPECGACNGTGIE